jgi:hypothetical protein
MPIDGVPLEAPAPSEVHGENVRAYVTLREGAEPRPAPT